MGGLAYVIAGTVALVACGDSVVPPDAPTYPAFSPPVITIDKGPGSVMPSVRVVPVFFPGDPWRDPIVTALGAFVQTTDLWRQLVGEYGVGGTTLAPPIDVTTAAPAMTTDAEIDLWLRDRLDGTHPEWGPTDLASRVSTVYVLYYPASTIIDGPDGRACSDFGAYHDATDISNGIVYAVMPRCPGAPPGLSELDGLIGQTTHELVESATDPYGTAYNFIAEEHYGWAVGGTEVSDLCQGTPDAFVRIPGSVVQRSWSNAAARAFRDPCVPAPDGPWFVTFAEEPDLVRQGSRQLRGTALTLGVGREIELRLASSSPAEDWEVLPVWEARGASPVLFELDRSSGHNGDVLHLRLTAIARPLDGTATFAIISTLGTRQTRSLATVGID